MVIRKMFKIYQFDPEWTVPSRMDGNPLAWMVEVNGLLMDMRHAPMSIQEIAYQRDSSLTSHRFRSDRSSW